MIYHNIDGVEIPFDPTWKNIAIGLSGGSDSALLTYILCSLIKNANTTVHVVNHIRCWKTKPWQQDDATRVFNWLACRFNYIEFIKHTNFIAPELEYAFMGTSLIDEYGKSVSGDNIQQRSYAEFICTKNNIDAYYNAVTRNPKEINLGGMPQRDIDSKDDNQHLYLMKHLDTWAIHPFRFVEKSWVYKQYKKLNILDLWNSTRSCEGTFKTIDYKNYIPNKTVVPECGQCFWCKERKWAQDVNN